MLKQVVKTIKAELIQTHALLQLPSKMEIQLN